MLAPIVSWLLDLIVGGKDCRSGLMLCVLRQDGSSKGKMDDSFCLRSDGLRAMEASVGVEKTLLTWAF